MAYSFHSLARAVGARTDSTHKFIVRYCVCFFFIIPVAFWAATNRISKDRCYRLVLAVLQDFNWIYPRNFMPGMLEIDARDFLASFLERKFFAKKNAFFFSPQNYYDCSLLRNVQNTKTKTKTKTQLQTFLFYHYTWR